MENLFHRHSETIIYHYSQIIIMRLDRFWLRGGIIGCIVGVLILLVRFIINILTVDFGSNMRIVVLGGFASLLHPMLNIWIKLFGQDTFLFATRGDTPYAPHSWILTILIFAILYLIFFFVVGGLIGFGWSKLKKSS